MQQVLQPYESSSGMVVLGRELENDRVLYAVGKNPFEAEVFIDSNAKKSSVTPFSLEQRIGAKLQGMEFFPEEETVLGKFSSLIGGVYSEKYSMGYREDNKFIILEKSIIDGYNRGVITNQYCFDLENSDLNQGNYFFMSSQFLKGDAALNKYEQLSDKKLNSK